MYAPKELRVQYVLVSKFIPPSKYSQGAIVSSWGAGVLSDLENSLYITKAMILSNRFRSFYVSLPALK